MNRMTEVDEQVGVYIMMLNAHYVLKLGNELNSALLLMRGNKHKDVFKAKVSHQFKLPQKRKESRSSRLRVNG